MAAFFRHRYYDSGAGGAVLVMVPSNSWLAGTDRSVMGRVSAALDALNGTVGRLRDLASFATFLTGLDALVTALPGQVYIAATAKNTIQTSWVACSGTRR